MIGSSVNKMVNERTNLAVRYINGLKRCLDLLSLEQVTEIASCLEEAYREGRHVFIIGNGGSAATASHMACDLGKNTIPREFEGVSRRFKVTALADNVPLITALANDMGYEYIFSEQLKHLAQKGDLLIAISGSGNSPNILEGVKTARALGLKTLGLLGFDGGVVREMVDVYVLVDSNDYGHIEDMHLVLNHLITAYLRSMILMSQ